MLRTLLPHHAFVKVRPSWLRNPATGRCLELDFYCEELAVAIEFNGAQHYRYVPVFHRDPDDLQQQQMRDKLKQDLCRRRGIRLLVLPFDEPDPEAWLRARLPTQ